MNQNINFLIASALFLISQVSADLVKGNIQNSENNNIKKSANDFQGSWSDEIQFTDTRILDTGSYNATVFYSYSETMNANVYEIRCNYSRSLFEQHQFAQKEPFRVQITNSGLFRIISFDKKSYNLTQNDVDENIQRGLRGKRVNPKEILNVISGKPRGKETKFEQKWQEAKHPDYDEYLEQGGYDAESKFFGLNQFSLIANYYSTHSEQKHSGNVYYLVQDGEYRIEGYAKRRKGFSQSEMYDLVEKQTKQNPLPSK